MTRRLVRLLLVLAVLGIPAGALRAVCAGRSCPTPPKPTRIPFCPLPRELRDGIEAGFWDGRSPEVLGVTRDATLGGGWRYPAAVAPGWPSIEGIADPRVPLVFDGRGIDPSAEVPAGTRLDAVAPTIAETIGLRRPNPGVRSGEAVAHVASGERPGLVLVVAWKGVGTEDLRAEADDWPFLRSLLRSGTGTLAAEPGSLPLDPAAVLTTIGTGGPPSEHGITGAILRNDNGRLTRAWGPRAPLSVIATIGDDLDHTYQQRALIGMVGTSTSDRGVIGGTWYLGHDRDAAVVVRNGAVAETAASTLAAGYGADDVPDLFAVVLEGSIRRMDASTERVAAAAERAAPDSVLTVVTSTGHAERAGRGEVGQLVREVEDAVPGTDPVVEAAAPGGLFLDQAALARSGITSSAVVNALRTVSGAHGEALMADAFQSFAVSFSRYC